MQIAVVLTHGMGSQTPAFAAELIAELTARLRRLGCDPDRVAWQPIYWADVLAPRQERYLAEARSSHEIDFVRTRRFVTSALGDAAAYQYVGGPSGTYVRIHDRIREGIRELYVDKLDGTAVPLVVMAHSLGSHIMSSYIWDTQHGKDTGADPDAGAFERLRHLAGMITFGSNIPLFTFAHDPGDLETIAFPGEALPPEVAEYARWLNFYDRDDVLGYPLRPTGPAYERIVAEDNEINVGGWGSMTPLSHVGYWTDNDFTRPVAEYLAGLL